MDPLSERDSRATAGGIGSCLEVRPACGRSIARPESSQLIVDTTALCEDRVPGGGDVFDRQVLGPNTL